MVLSLEQVVNREGIVLFDASATNTNLDFVIALYDCSDFIHLPHIYLKQVLVSLQEARQVIKSSKVQTTPLVPEEVREFLKILNQQASFHEARAAGKQKYHRRDKRITQDLDDEEKEYDRENIKVLRTMSNTVFDICRLLERRNIFASLSEEQVDTIQRLTTHLKETKDLRGNKEDKRRYNHHLMRSKGPLKLPTDEELVSTAMLLARTEPVTIVTRDHHMRSIVRGAMKSRLVQDRFSELYQANQVSIFTSYSTGDKFSLVYDSDNPKLCERAAQQSYEHGKEAARQRAS